MGRQLRFPESIIISQILWTSQYLFTTFRPDSVLVENSTKKVVMLELTVPWEERMEEADKRKRGKYTKLVEECRRQGCSTGHQGSTKKTSRQQSFQSCRESLSKTVDHRGQTMDKIDHSRSCCQDKGVWSWGTRTPNDPWYYHWWSVQAHQ